MGFDLTGRNPTSEVGRTFRNNVWHWRPLANYIATIAPSIYNDSWQYNDGKGPYYRQAIKLAALLQAEIDNGNCAAYATNYLRCIQALPDEKCNLCHGTGRRNDSIVTGTCNKCEGKGHCRPLDTWYFFSIENVQEFTNFCRESGGFQIW